MAYYLRLPKDTDLTFDQREAIYEKAPIALSGHAGTGKTIVSLYRHIVNLKENKNFILTTYTKSLTTYLKMALEDNQKHSVRTSYKFFYSIRNSITSFDEIIIDEAQDLPYEILKIFRDKAKRVSYGADFNQKLYNNTILPEQIVELFPNNKTILLEEHFRNSYAILRFVKAIFPKLKISQDVLDELKEENYGYKPEIFIGKDFEDEIYQIKKLVNEFHSDTHNIAILLPFGRKKYGYDNLSVEEFVEFLDGEFNFSYYYSSENDVYIDNIHITTFKSAKGLEFDTVIIPSMHKINDIIKKEEYISERDYYVGFTRARTNLFLTTQTDKFKNKNVVEIKNIERKKFNIASIDIDEEDILF